MLGKLRRLYSQLKELTPREIDRVVKKVLVENADVILDLNEEQLLKGKDGNNKDIGTYKSKSYAKYKKKLNPSARGKVDLKLTGRFHDSRYLRNDPVLRIWARDLKVDPLVRKYGASFFKLTPQSLRTLANVVAPQIVVRLRRKMGL